MSIRIALINDPHGDLIAFQAVAADIDRRRDLTEVLVGGDLAQRGPQPAEVVPRTEGQLRYRNSSLEGGRVTA